MKQGLFESLVGKFADGTPIDAVPESQRRQKSIMDHLNRLFNARQGSISHLDDYGLPDISEVYRKMPDGLEELASAIKRTVDHYEPRLKNVKVVQTPTEKTDFKLVYIVSGEMVGGGGMVRFQTTFTSLGQSSIIPWRKAE